MVTRNLPVDLIEEILSRVPTKYLAKLRTTSKQWNALSKSGSFAKKHSANAPKESLIMMLIDSRVYLVRINLNGIHNNVSPSVRVAYQFNLCNSSQVDIRDVFHCDGLLLCTTEDNRLVLWNPCSGETKWIKPRDSYKDTDYYALGYDNISSCKQYKILKVDHQYSPIITNNEYEIYDFTTNSWRVAGVATGWFLSRSRRGVSVKGNTYWVATQAGSPYPRFLLSFDFSTERFQSLSLPHPFPKCIPALSVVKEEKLCLLVMSWSTSLAMKAYDNCERYKYKISDGISFFADEENKVVVCCHPNNILQIVEEQKQILLGIDSTRRLHCSVLLNYVPSLAQTQH